MTAKLVRLTDCVEDVRFEDVRSTLERAQKILDEWKAAGYEPTKCICVFLDDRDGHYAIKTQRSSMKVSETIALLEVLKQCEINDMGFYRS